VVLSGGDRIAKAEGKVKLNGKDGFVILSQKMYWNTSDQEAYFEGDVRCRHHDLSLETPTLWFNSARNEARYELGGVLRQGGVRISSRHGVGDLNRRDYTFREQVVVNHPEMELHTSLCRYMAQVDCLILMARSRIHSLQGTFEGDAGHYQIQSAKLLLHMEGKSGTGPVHAAWAVVDRRHFILADTLFMDQKRNMARAEGNVHWLDSVEHIRIRADHLKLDSALRMGLNPPNPVNLTQSQGFMATGHVWLLDCSTRDSMHWITSSLQGYRKPQRDSMLLWTDDSSVCLFKDWVIRCNTIRINRASSTLQANGNLLAWQGLTQLESQAMLWKRVNDSLSLMDFEGITALSEIADSIPNPMYHQASGSKAHARLMNNELQQFELEGNAVTWYWMLGNDSLWSALNKTEAAKAVFEVADRRLHSARYYGGPRGAYQPMSKIKDHSTLLETVHPRHNLRIKLRSDFDSIQIKFPDRGLGELIKMK
ncbi:MAG: OstA-like protein, partial [Bacteroidota bacterium]